MSGEAIFELRTFGFTLALILALGLLGGAHQGFDLETYDTMTFDSNLARNPLGLRQIYSSTELRIHSFVLGNAHGDADSPRCVSSREFQSPCRQVRTSLPSMNESAIRRSLTTSR